MGWLKSLLGGSKYPNSDKVLDECIQMVRNGHAVDGVLRMRECSEQIEQAAGRNSLAHAKSLFNEATLHCAVQDLGKAADLCRQAVDVCPDDKPGRKERLTYLMNLGQMLNRSGKLQESIEVLRKSLEERVAFYGAEHAGVAYGHQVLAETLVMSGNYSEGLEQAEAACSIFERERHFEYPNTFALRAACRNGLGQPPPITWARFADYPDDVVDKIAGQASEVAALIPDASRYSYLGGLALYCKQYIPNNHLRYMNALVTWNNVAKENNNLDELGKATEQILSSISFMPEPETQISLLQGCAMSLSECNGQKSGIREIYEQAAQLASDQNLMAPLANVERNWAIFENESGDSQRADQLYQQAIRNCRTAGKTCQELLGRSIIAYAIFLQHHSRTEGVADLFDEGLRYLPATHPDAACGMLHLAALRSNLKCACDGGVGLTEQAFGQLAKSFFEQQGLAEILESVEFNQQDGLAIRLRRSPQPDELQRLQVAQQVLVSQLSANK